MRYWPLIALLVGCEASTSVGGDGGVDTPDSAPAAPCPNNPALSICLAFDEPAFGATLANEGSVMLTASLQNVSRTSVPPGAAALLTSTSAIAFPPNTVVTDIVLIEARIRMDQAIPTGMRAGLVDTEDPEPAGMSMFIYEGGTTATHRVRCNMGGVDVYADTSIELATWVELQCTCIAGVVGVVRDGMKLAEMTGCTPAAGTDDGIQIGQNNRLTDGLPPNDPFVGAIDRVRMWTAIP